VSDQPFDFQGLKLLFVGLGMMMLAGWSGVILCDPGILVRLALGTGLTAGFGVALSGGVLHFRELLRMDKLRRMRDERPN
jgi:hypothetical protein